jgi:signal transduction histidine kinase
MERTLMTTPDDTRARGGGRRLLRMTVQGWFLLALSVMIVVVAVGTVIGAHLLSRTNEAADRLIQHIGPAQAEAYRLQATLIDQETGARGYVLTGDRQFLTPYTKGQQSEKQSADEIRQLLPNDPQVLADLTAIEDNAAQWRREDADPMVADVTPGKPEQLSETTAAGAKQAFDHIRTLFAAQNTDLAAARSSSLADLDHVRTQRDWVLSLMVAAFFLTVALMVVLIRFLVIRPLQVLRISTRRVAAGLFDHPITEHGPEDVRAVARDVDTMRGRIVEELDASRAQEQQLGELAADLDVQAAELRRSNAELEQFAYVASHDLQEPLRKVASFCQLLEKRYGDALDERGQQYIDFAVDGAKRMQILITDLLTFSRVGRMSEMQRTVDLGLKLDKALANLETAIGESGTRIERPEQLPAITGDATLLIMLWQNLIGNAIKFRAADKTPVISIDCQRVDNGGADEWSLSVTDNGIGIPAEFAEKVFVIFQRLHSRETYTGTGIGLALCKKIVEYHGGRIWLDTGYTEGSRICFTLPAEVPAGPDTIPNRTVLKESTP